MYSIYAVLRDKKGLTDYAVAAKTGIKESTFYDWRQRSEKDPKTKMSVGNLKKLAVFFGVPIEYFLDDSEAIP